MYMTTDIKNNFIRQKISLYLSTISPEVNTPPTGITAATENAKICGR